MSRLPDWERRLSAYLASVTARPHVYGEHDCLLHCAAVVEALTGVDLGAEHRGKYHDEAGAKAYLESLGYASPAHLIDAHLSAKARLKAGRGDVILDDEGVPGGCIGGEALMVGMKDGDEGLVRVPRARWVRAWAVG